MFRGLPIRSANAMVLFYAQAVILLVGVAAIAVQFVGGMVDAVQSRRRREVVAPPAALIPRRVDLRDDERVDAWLYRRGLEF